MRRVPLGELVSSPEEIRRLREVLDRGGLVALPTETSYGLAADPFHTRGVRRIFEAKGRPGGKPLLVLFADRGELDALGVTAPEALLERLFGIWPAPLTVILPIREPIAASADARSLAVRLPALEPLRRVLAGVGPMTGTSANRSGDPALDEPDDVAAVFGRDLDCLVDGGRTAGGSPSTLLDATIDPPVVLRAGAFPWPYGA